MSIPVSSGDDIRFRRLSLADGLSQTRVAQIIQDNEGYLWFGTQHGLNRFDGLAYRVFKNEPDQAGSLSGTFIYALFKDRARNRDAVPLVAAVQAQQAHVHGDRLPSGVALLPLFRSSC
ncbi:hypothetical protein HJB60_04070 [Rhizobium lentis]|uniref:Uncharacterized protein n=1 Tax=Rhizobium lentis TaxID=1138194 RepID=A0ABS7ICM9_9HYPH|nr:hypothetical protein [Rhizobium lentis]